MAKKFSQYLYDFAAYLEVQKNLSPRTMSAYCYEIERFSNFLIKSNDKSLAMPHPAKIKREDLNRYLEYLKLKHDVKNAAIARVMSSFRVFFEFLVLNDVIEDNPASLLHNPKNPKKLPIFLTNHELAELFKVPDREDVMGSRDYAILISLAFTGMRLSELVGLDENDINFQTKQLRVMGKGSKERIIPLNDIVLESLREYLDKRPITDDPAVFLNKNKQRISGRGVQNIVKKYVQLAGLKQLKISPHKLRHTFATLLHLNDVDLLEIQKLMGHASISSTQIYTHTNMNKLESAVNKLTLEGNP